jgi:hypothetical protein
MRAWVAIVLAMAAGCAAPQKPERLVRPHRVETHASAEVEPVPAIGLELLVREPEPSPPVTAADVSTVRPSLPPAPRVTPLARPRSGGDALRLADRALELGDALDAAAQYRPLLAAARPADAPYIQFQLARALVAMGQRSEATSLLWSVAHSKGPEAWPALLLLADVRSREIGVPASLRELRSIAGERLTMIEMHLIHLAGPYEAAALLLSAADQTEMQGVACGYTLAAVERIGAQGIPDDVRYGRCRAEIDAYLGLPVGEDPIFDDAITRWEHARDLTDRGQLEPRAWLDAASTYVNAQRRARSSDELDAMRRNTYYAWLNAVVVAMRSGRINDQFMLETQLILDHVGPLYLDDATRVYRGLTAHARNNRRDH